VGGGGGVAGWGVGDDVVVTVVAVVVELTKPIAMTTFALDFSNGGFYTNSYMYTRCSSLMQGTAPPLRDKLCKYRQYAV